MLILILLQASTSTGVLTTTVTAKKKLQRKMFEFHLNYAVATVANAEAPYRNHTRNRLFLLYICELKSFEENFSLDNL